MMSSPCWRYARRGPIRRCCSRRATGLIALMGALGTLPPTPHVGRRATNAGRNLVMAAIGRRLLAARWSPGRCPCCRGVRLAAAVLVTIPRLRHDHRRRAAALDILAMFTRVRPPVRRRARPSSHRAMTTSARYRHYRRAHPRHQPTGFRGSPAGSARASASRTGGCAAQPEGGLGQPSRFSMAVEIIDDGSEVDEKRLAGAQTRHPVMTQDFNLNRLQNSGVTSSAPSPTQSDLPARQVI